MNFLLPVITGFLGRWGGGGYRRLPYPFSIGVKAVRRYGIPVALFLFGTPWWACVLISVALHLNMDAIEDRDWWKIASWGYLVSALTFPNQGWLCLLAGTWWWIGVYWSNIGFWEDEEDEYDDYGQPMRIDWFWVEIIFYTLLGIKL